MAEGRGLGAVNLDIKKKNFFVKKLRKSCHTFVKLLTFNRSAPSCTKSLLSAKVTPKQCPGAILISDSKKQSASCVSVKCDPNNFRVANCNSIDLRVVSYNTTSLRVASCEVIIRL